MSEQVVDPIVNADVVSPNGQVMLAIARANIYNFLAAVYAAPPMLDMIAGLLDRTSWAPLRAALEVFDAVQPHLADLEQALRGGAPAALAEALAVEYTRLFVGPGPGYVAPYQSVYTDQQTIELCGMPYSGVAPAAKKVAGLLWGESTVAATRCYREAGVEPMGELAGVPDHLAIELQFMQHLCDREAAAWHSGRPAEASEWARRQQSFLTAHLAPWVRSCAARVLAAAQHPWYRATAALTGEFVAEELAAAVSGAAEGMACSA